MAYMLTVRCSDGFSLSSPHQRRRYQQLLAALASGARRQVQIDASAVTDEMAGLRQALNLYHAYDMGPNFVAGEIEARISRLQDVARQLSTDQRPFLRALGHAVKVFLPLSWPCESVDVDVATLAVDLRRSLESSHRRLCSSVDLTSWQFLVGALGSEAGSGHQKWFLLRLRKLLSSSPFRTWENVLSMWQNAFMPDDRVLEQFKRLWEECIQGKERT